MINRNEFQKSAKRFRGGQISLSEFTDVVFEKPGNPADLNSSGNETIHLRLPVRPANSHKGDFGRVVLIGGSADMPGAIALSGLAALRMGSGLVVVITPVGARGIVASFSPCLMTVVAKSKDGFFGRYAQYDLEEKCDWADVIAIGPGMGRKASCQEIVEPMYKELEKPIVLDADAINNLADANVDFSQHAGPRILTPHPGEFETMVGEKFKRRSEMEDCAIDMARRTQTTILLKGPQSIVTDGERVYRNETGNEGMATAGSGDVLTGVIISLLGQKMSPFESAQTGCYLHGLAGDIYSEKKSSASLIATDLIDELPAAMSRLGAGSSS